MAIPHPALETSPRLIDRITAMRHRHFVGRTAELDLFRQALLAASRRSRSSMFTARVVWAKRRCSTSTGTSPRTPVCRSSGSTAATSNRRPPASCLRSVTHSGWKRQRRRWRPSPAHARGVLFIDTYEILASLDTWIRETLLPQLPSGFFVVIAGRNPPAAAWRTDLGWPELVRIMPLRNLRPEESRAYLDARGVPDARACRRCWPSPMGIPLALALVSDVLMRGDARASFLPEHEPDVVQALLERFVRTGPQPAPPRRARGLCPHPRHHRSVARRGPRGGTRARAFHLAARALLHRAGATGTVPARSGAGGARRRPALAQSGGLPGAAWSGAALCRAHACRRRADGSSNARPSICSISTVATPSCDPSMIGMR